MNAYDLILRKRDGQTLDAAELAWFVDGFTSGDIADYQAAAFCMAVFFNGMTSEELGQWTRAMLFSGEVLDLSFLPGPKIDKHSTGGVGDKVSLPLAPLVAAAGVYVPMISGRGLGHTGGTLDKLESIPGFRTDLTLDAFKKQLTTLGCGLIGQTAEIAPADKKLYALRDVTATVDCIPLIASSIMSKKLAEGIDGLVLDVKTGRGAFMKDLDGALALARTMIGIGEVMGKQIVARITAMDQPLGRCVGNGIEVLESIALLRGEGPDDLLEVVLTLGAEMLMMAGVEQHHEDAVERLQGLVDGGQGLERFGQIIEAQGGDPRVVDDPSILPIPACEHAVLAPQAGVIHVLDALVVGKTARLLGAGRQTMQDSIDPAAGIYLHHKVGDTVETGQPIATLLAASDDLFAAAEQKLLSGLSIEDAPLGPQPLLIDRIAGAISDHAPK